VYEKPTRGQKAFRMKRAMTRKRNRPDEIMAKLSETNMALCQEKTLEDIEKQLGVPLMMLHQWRTEYESTDRANGI
jgi:hypothetical protein